MPNYELMLMVDPFLEETEHQGLVEKAQEQIKRRGGAVTNVDVWGKRRLAYPIEKKLEGFYALLSFNGDIPAAELAEIERTQRLDEQVMRVMITRIPDIKPRRTKPKKQKADRAGNNDNNAAGYTGNNPQSQR